MGAGAILRGLVQAGTKARLGHVQGLEDVEAPTRQRESFDYEQGVQQQNRLAEIDARAKADRVTNSMRPREPKPPNEMQVAARSDALRNQFNQDPSYKNAVTIAEQYGNVESASRIDTAAGDLKLIFSYMKMLDPGSTVREGEFANAQNAAGIPDQIRNLYNRANKGTRLNPRQRQDFLAQAKSTMDSQRKLLEGVKSRYGGVAQRRGINPEEIVYDPFEVYDQEQESPVVSEALKIIQSGEATLEQALASPNLTPQEKAAIRKRAAGGQ
jgi:hypothetical protein